MTIISTVVTKILSYAISGLMLVSSLFPGPMGNYAKLQAERLELMSESAVHDTEELTVTANADAILKLFGVDDIGIDLSGDVKLTAEVDSYLDLSDLDLYSAISMGAEFGGISVSGIDAIMDDEYEALSPELMELVLGLAGEEEEFPEEMKDMYIAVPTGMKDELDVEISEEDIAVFDLVFNGLDVIFGDVCEEDFTKIVKDFSEPQRKLYHAETVGGYNAYSYKATGTDLLKAIDKSLENFGKIDSVNSFFNIVNTVLISSGEGTLSGNDLAMAKAEIYKAIPTVRSYLAPFIDQNAEIPADLAGIEEYLPIIRAIADNSKFTARIYKNIAGKFIVDETVLISDGKTTYLECHTRDVLEKYVGEIPSCIGSIPEDKLFIMEFDYEPEYLEDYESDDLLPPEPFDVFDEEDAYTYDDIDGIEFIWTSFLAPGATEQTIEGAFGAAYVNIEGGEPAPVDIVEIDLIMIGSRSYVEVGDVASLAGIECTIAEDGKTAEWKLGDKTVTMELTDVDGAKYIKVRDFEKLGAKVDYTEQMVPTELVTTVDCLTYKASAAVISF